MLTEGEILKSLRDHLKAAEGCARQMAAWRGDQGWLMLARLYAENYQKVETLANQRGGIAHIWRPPVT